ncbi:Snakin-2 [Carex littledalei]|uniref:Snakin-2 n=1 Tax=Carex littledalei TaxID=544730 RepID=A0A833R5W4_9POAL|nr:Snakin-2 [Carex littledalei]
MAKSNLLFAFLLFLVLIEMNVIEQPMQGVQAIDCKAKCDVRCSKNWKPKMCHRACGTCCERCKCVPSGTSGNKEECPCYANMKTHGNRYKCP